MKKSLSFIVLGALALLLAACNLVNPVFTITCTNVILTADFGSYTVDNSGTGYQIVYMRAFDGYGNVLMNYNETNTVGSSFSGINNTYGYATAPLANPIRVEIFSPAGNALPSDTVWYSATGNCPGLPSVGTGAPFTDGRLNNFDQAAPFIVYRAADSFEFYMLDNNRVGQVMMVVTDDKIASIPNQPAENTLIEADETIGLYVYRLTTGELQAQMQMSNGKLYVVIFDENGLTYESNEIEP